MPKATVLLVAFCLVAALPRPAAAAPHIGYVYPAGGARGTTVRVAIGGQNLVDVKSVLVEGGGVQARVVSHLPQLLPSLKLLATVMSIKLSAPRSVSTTGLPAPGAPDREHPLVHSLRSLSSAEVTQVIDRLRDPRKRQPMAQIAETLLVDLCIASDAEPGLRELRGSGPAGLTNRLVFEIGTRLELSEREPNDPDRTALRQLTIPATINGQILPGDADCFLFVARRGQRFRFDVRARRLLPFLADAVPGWFEPLLTVTDGSGREIASSDGCGIDPDPLLFFDSPADGTFRLTLRDVLYRGRFDFAYRLTVDDVSAPTDHWPRDPERPWNDEPLAELRGPGVVPAPIVPAAPDLPVVREAPPKAGAQDVSVPVAIAGCIDAPGAVDRYRFRGRAGERLVIDVVARRAWSPLDSTIELEAPDGRILASNDDHPRLNVGLLTHHADSHLDLVLPADGLYTVSIADAQVHGGLAYTYQLRLSPPRPGFTVYVVPSAIEVLAGPAVPLGFLVERHDGYQGEIELALQQPPDGWRLAGGRIPAGADSVRATLALPPGSIEAPLPLRLVATGMVGSRRVLVPVVPADEVIQSFSLRHVVLAATSRVAGRGPAPATRLVRVAPETGVRLPVGGTATALVRIPAAPTFRGIGLELIDPPRGISLSAVTTHPAGFELRFEARPDALASRDPGNLIVQVLFTPPGGNRRVPIGCLPAIPLQVLPAAKPR
ncbi:MAG: hypothetical protein HY815_21635 [Candidatus Riflebacteria bacterium]|nr:hypothetical protein [Candidatus Riflebacteria bacterium]